MKDTHSDKRAEDGPAGGHPHQHEPSPTPEQLATLAERLHALRARQASVFGPEPIGDAGWEILAALYRARGAGLRVTVSNAIRSSAAPESTARRWLDQLVELGLVTRAKSRTDLRTVFVELDVKAVRVLDEYFAEMWALLHTPIGGRTL